MNEPSKEVRYSEEYVLQAIDAATAKLREEKNELNELLCAEKQQIREERDAIIAKLREEITQLEIENANHRRELEKLDDKLSEQQQETKRKER